MATETKAERKSRLMKELGEGVEREVRGHQAQLCRSLMAYVASKETNGVIGPAAGFLTLQQRMNLICDWVCNMMAREHLINSSLLERLIEAELQLEELREEKAGRLLKLKK